MSDPEIEIAKLVVSILGFGGTIMTIAMATRQYRRAEQWKRAEFVAKEVKEFENSLVVRNALAMVDWGARRVNLRLKQNPEDGDLIRVTREMQWKALLPHSVKDDSVMFRAEDLEFGESDQETDRQGFTSIEARIRDTYDMFLDHLQRFSNVIESGLVGSDELHPYLSYWLNTIASPEGSQKDIAWRCALFTYINFYEFKGVQQLFSAFGRPIEPGAPLFRKLFGQLRNADLKEALERSLKQKRQQAEEEDA